MAGVRPGTPRVSGLSTMGGTSSAAELGVNIEISGGAGRRVSAARVVGELEKICHRRGVTEGALRISFADANGPKGGRDQRCAISLRLPRRTALHVERTETTAGRAWRFALDAFEQRLQAFLAERRAAARRPKKYYAAQRLQR
jgi:hypothetical protein